MDSARHWSEDRYWTEALERLYRLREKGVTKLTIDLAAIDSVIFDGDGPAYRLMEAMRSVWEQEGMEGFRGAPRVLLATPIRLEEISERPSPAQ